MILLLILLLIIYVYLKYSQKEDFMNNNKTIWMYWEQGEENLKNEYNKKCIKQWRHLHPTWNVRVLNYDKALELIPDLKKTNPRDLQRKREPTLMLIGKYYQCFHRNTDLNNMMKHVQQSASMFLDVPIWDPRPPIWSKMASGIHWDTSRRDTSHSLKPLEKSENVGFEV